MKKKILSLVIVGMTVFLTLTGCSNKNKTNDSDVKFVISNENVDVAEYKGLEAEKYNSTVTDAEVDTYIEYVMNYDGNDTSDSKYSISDLTDEMVKTISGGDYDNIQSYRDYIKSVIEEQNLTYYEQNTKEALFKKVVDNSVLKTYDKDKLQKYIDYANEYYEEYAKYLNEDLEKLYTDTMGFSSKEEYNKYIEEESLNNLKKEYVIRAIADAEKIDIKDEDVDSQVQSYIDDGYFEQKDDVLNYISEEEIQNNLKYSKILDLIYDSAKFVESTESTESSTENTENVTETATQTSEVFNTEK